MLQQQRARAMQGGYCQVLEIDSLLYNLISAAIRSHRMVKNLFFDLTNHVIS